MSPTAIDQFAAPHMNLASVKPAKGPALVIGSLKTAEDGTYQSLISDLESSRSVEKQLLDRIVDEGLSSSIYL